MAFVLIFFIHFAVNIAEERLTLSKTQYSIHRVSGKAVDVALRTFYRSEDKPEQWWRVELDGTVYVKELSVQSKECEYNILFATKSELALGSQKNCPLI